MSGVTDLRLGDSLHVMPTLAESSVDAIVTDPPYGLEFMGKQWDHGIPGVPFWQAALRVLKPGGYMLAMGGTRTYHRLACAVEDAGFEIRDCLMWVYGSGFPKGKGCLKPAWEPILLARKPGKKVLPLGIDECRVSAEERPLLEADRGRSTGNTFAGGLDGSLCGSRAIGTTTLGRWPANLVHDGSDEVMEAFAAFGESKSPPVGSTCRSGTSTGNNSSGGKFGTFTPIVRPNGHGDTGTAARFFYCAKASRAERGKGNSHPTVKPLALMEWLVKLVAREGETVLDPFTGSGTTGIACVRLGRSFVGVEQDQQYHAIAKKRIAESIPALFR